MGIHRRRLLTGLGATAAALTGCVEVREDEPVEVRKVYWPPPPSPPRLVYELTLRSNLDLETQNETARLRSMLTGVVTEEHNFVKPYAVAASGGRVYVSDTAARRVHVFDVPRRRYFQFGFRFEGELVKPVGLSVDGAGRVYVADVSAGRVVVYDRLGLYLGAMGHADELDRVTDVAANAAGSRVYAVDLGGVESRRHRVVVYAPGKGKQFEFGTRGAGDGEFNLPVAAAVAPDGTLYVLDAGNFRVQAFDPDGRHLRSFGALGRGFGQFARPKAIATDRAGNVYVADAAFGNVQIFDPQGRLLLPVGQASRSDGPGLFALLTGVAVDEKGFVYLLDQVFNKIDVLRLLSADEVRGLAGA
jgi:DNA-binding beta-propeller fold protein YncE